MSISMDGCGETKGCYRNPKGCSEVECDVAVTWQDKGNTILFELSADTDGWVAVGFSEDKKMVRRLCAVDFCMGKPRAFLADEPASHTCRHLFC